MGRRGLSFKFLVPVLATLAMVMTGAIYLVTEAQTTRTEHTFQEHLTALAQASRSMVHSAAEDYCKAKGMQFHRIQADQESGDKEETAFQRSALKQFNTDPKAETLIHRYTSKNGDPQLYVLAPARLKEECITCHEGYGLKSFNGRKEGDLIGAFGVSMSMAPLQNQEASDRGRAALGGLAILVIIGLTVRFFVHRTILRPLHRMSEAVHRMAAGDMAIAFPDKPGDELGEVLHAMERLATAFHSLSHETELLTTAAREGRLEIRSDATAHQGDFRRVIEGFNRTLDTLIAPVNTTVGFVDRISRGDVPAPIEDVWQGDFMRLRDSLNRCIGAVKCLVEDAGTLNRAALEGQLTVRAQADRHQGDFRKVIQGVNDTLDAVIGPIQEVLRVMAALESGDLGFTIEVPFKGDMERLRTAVNATVHHLQSTIWNLQQEAQELAVSAGGLTETSRRLSVSADQTGSQARTAAAATHQAGSSVRSMAAGVEQVSANSQTVATAAEEINANLSTVGRSVEQMSANLMSISRTSGQMNEAVGGVATAIEEMGASLQGVLRNANHAAEVAGQAASTADTTTAVVARLGTSAEAIGKVVDIIKGIADQTNLLALNATIEAASAGEAGKGFAVVAGEVKALAKQTAAATEEIRSQITDMQANTRQVMDAMNNIGSIIQDVDRTSKVITTAVEEQNTATRDIGRNVIQAAQGATDMAGTIDLAARGSGEVSRNVHEAVKGVASIAHSISELASGSVEMARSASEAAQGMDEAAKGVQQVSQVAQDTTRGAAEANNAAQQLAALAERLQQAVRKFRL